MTALGMLTSSLRFSFRLARFELVAFVALAGGLIVASIAALGWLDSIRPAADCFRLDVLPASCGPALNAWYETQGRTTSLLAAALTAVPFLAGLLLGVPLVARELERGTARLAWSLTPSRTGWYLVRLLPVIGVLALGALAAGAVLDRLTLLSAPGVDPDRAFIGFGMRGGLIASRAIFVFTLGVALGAISGRSLPGLILAGVVAAIGLTGGEAVHQRILRGEAVPIAEAAGTPGDLFVDQRFQLPDGQLVDWQYFGDRPPITADGEPYPIINFVVPGERYRSVEAREAIVLAGGSLLALGLGLAVTVRRRPE